MRDRPTRRHIHPFLALWPTLPLVFPAAQLKRIGRIGELPWILRAALLTFLVMNGAAALLSAQPVLSISLILLKTAWISGLLILGWLLRSPDRLWPVAIGLLIVYLTAFLTLPLAGNPLGTRLSHPFFMPASLGLASGVGVLLALWVPHRHVVWRLGFGALSALTLTGAASRVVVVGVVLATLAGLIYRTEHTRRAVLTLLSLVTVGALLIPGASRIFNFAGAGRDEVWFSAINLLAQKPWTGYGPYQAGSQLHPATQCSLFDAMTFLNISNGTCPAWLTQLNNPWIVAHNEALQALLEGGLLGGTGTFVLLGVSLLVLLRSRNPFLVGVGVLGFTAALVDNPFFLPSSFFGEFFYCCVGLAARLQSAPTLDPTEIKLNPSNRTLAPVIGMLALLPFPLWIAGLHPRHVPPPVLSRLSSDTVRTGEPYVVSGQLSPSGAGPLKILLRSCTPTCFTVAQIATPAGTPFQLFWRPSSYAERTTLQLVALRGDNSLTSHVPLAVTQWTVDRE